VKTWWDGFFDEDYIHVWGGMLTPERNAQAVEGLWQLLQLQPGLRVLDAPCGYGRLSKLLAERGAVVVGADQSAQLLAHAEQTRGALQDSQLRYLLHDLRSPLPESGFDAAFNVFSSIGYGTEEDDLAVFRTLRAAVKPGGLVLLDTMHRDAVVALMVRGGCLSNRLPDGTLVVEEPTFDAVAGRVDTRWYWSGPHGSGQKAASLRVYTATELLRLIEQAGMRVRSTHRGCSTARFVVGPDYTRGRLAVLAEVP
jgi:SAM-dependent methyltransferase